ncbi:MAG TPA: hypothetical protein VGB51_05245 [Actinomycetota bacterium]
MADEAGTPPPPPSPAEGAPPPPPAEGTPPPTPPPAADTFKERKWIPVIVLFLVTTGITLGGFFVAGALEDVDEQSSVTIGPVTIHPPGGWEVAEQLTQPVEGVRLANGSGYADVFAGSFGGDAAGLYQEYMNILAGSASQGRDAQQFRYTLEPEPFTGPSGIQGVRGFYIGSFDGLSAPIEGEVFGFVGPAGEGIIFDGWASENQYPSVADDVREMVSTSELLGVTAEQDGVAAG